MEVPPAGVVCVFDAVQGPVPVACWAVGKASNSMQQWSTQNSFRVQIRDNLESVVEEARQAISSGSPSSTSKKAAKSHSKKSKSDEEP